MQVDNRPQDLDVSIGVYAAMLARWHVYIPADVSDTAMLMNQLSSEHSGKCCCLGGRSFAPPSASTANFDGWDAAPLWPQRAPITQGNACHGLYSLAPCTLAQAQHACVCTLKGAGTHLKDGVLELGAGGVLVVEGSCEGVCFSHLTIRGEPPTPLSSRNWPRKAYFDGFC